MSLQSHPEYTPARYKAVVALNRLMKDNNMREEDFKSILEREDSIEDHSLEGQQICRHFLSS